jgi:hypothetical protein
MILVRGTHPTGSAVLEMPLNHLRNQRGWLELFLFMYHQRIGGDFDKSAGCKGGFDA